VGGVDIPKGARLMLMYGSGNRDEAAFSDPARFDICRQAEAQHLAFGRGIHFCVGSSLARLEGRVALEALAIRLPGLRLDPEAHVEWRPNAAFRCPTGLPLIWTTG
jgi:cytochrome P450